MDNSNDRILSAQEAAQRLNLSVRTLGQIASTRSDLQKVQLSTRRVGYRESDISLFMENGGVA